jgi:hypothetical protein
MKYFLKSRIKVPKPYHDIIKSLMDKGFLFLLGKWAKLGTFLSPDCFINKH